MLGSKVAEISSGSGWTRHYVYLGGQLLAIQDGQVIWVHQDPITKSQRLTDTSGNPTSTRIELDPFGGDTSASANGNSQPYKYTSYERDGNGSDYAMARSRNTWFSRFYQPDPYDGSYNMADPQSFNRYAYTQNDPVNFTDPSGLDGDVYHPFVCTNCNQFPGTIGYLGGRGGGGGGGGGGGRGVIEQAAEENADGGTGGGGGGGGGGGIHEVGHSTGSNPNCLRYAVRGSPGVGDPFKVFPRDKSRSGHIGAHALSPPGLSAEAVTLPPLAGTIIKTNAQDASLFYLDVRLANDNVAVYFDLQTVRKKSGYLRAGDKIGTVRPGDPRNNVGLHVTIVLGQYYKDFNLHRGEYTANGPTKYFIDPLGPDSPIRCPGETVKP